MEKAKKILKFIGNSIVNIVLGLFALVVLKFAYHLVFYFALLFLWFFTMNADMQDRYLYEFEIEAMKDSQSYVVSRRNVDNQLKFHFIREIDGELRTGNTNASDSSIVEDGNSKVMVYEEEPVKFTKLYRFLLEQASFTEDQSLKIKKYVYHIPEGTVKMEYDIDLE